MLIYKSEDVGFLLKALSPIVPLMYLDSISDGILKGLDQQVFSFRTAVSDSLMRIVLIIFLLPKTGLYGFIGIMYFSNFLTCFLNVGRLMKISGATLKPIKEIILPVLSAFCVTLLSNLLVWGKSAHNNLVYIILLCVLSLPIYFILLIILGVIEKEEILHYLGR